MKPVAALVVITLTLLAGPLTGVATAAPDPAARGPAPALSPAGGAGPLRLDIAQLTPRVVEAGGPGALTLTGTLTNTGDDPVSALGIRVQRGNPLTTEGELRDALDGTAVTDAVTPEFAALPDLAPGAQIPVQLAVPLRGAPETSLALASTGVHELLVNVNGVPGEGARARLAAVRLLLPVRSLPPDPQSSEVPTATSRSGAPTPFSMLYPIADTPRRLSTVPGEPTLLTDDELATSFPPQGRLGGLVAALAASAPVGSTARGAVCLAVDAELLATADAMRSGYEVVRPDGSRVPGAGAAAAGRWLDDLAAVARGGCVLALPHADADLVALTRGGLPDLAGAAVTDGRATVAELLGTPVLPRTTWPADGVLDEPTLGVLGEDGGRFLVLSADGVEQRRSRDRGVLAIEGEAAPQVAVLTDPLLELAAAGPAASTATGAGRGNAAQSGTPAGTVTALSTQDLIGALAFRVAAGPGTDADVPPLVLAPPHRWAAEGTGARALLDTVGGLIADGSLAPRGLGALLGTGPPPDADPRSLAYPLAAGGREIPQAVVETIADTARDITDLRSAAVEDSPVGVSPEEAFTPLWRGAVRPASAAWRGRPAEALQAADAGAGRITQLRSSIRVLEPPSPYSLGTSDAPLLITVANGLPVTVRVRMEVEPSAGLRVAPIPSPEIPPLGRRQVSADAQVTRSGQFTVKASVRTPDGQLLGPPSRLRVSSTAYGTISVWLTVGAGVLLVVLAVRRILRRIRREPGRHSGPPDQGGPPPPRPGPPPPDPPGPPPGRGTRAGTPFPDQPTDRFPDRPPGRTAEQPTDRIPTHPRRGGGSRPPGPPPPPRVPSP